MAVLLEARSYRPFRSSDEYLLAMKEDLAEWLNALYPELRINVDNFMDRLDTGVALCKVSADRGHVSLRLSTSVLFFFLFFFGATARRDISRAIKPSGPIEPDSHNDRDLYRGRNAAVIVEKSSADRDTH